MNNKLEFKKRNLLSWKKNSEFWLNSELRQLTDTKDFLLKKIPTLFNESKSDLPVVIDMGTGSGWALDLLLELKIETQFIGLDFNEKFIAHLKQKFLNFQSTEFHCIDLEENIPNDFRNKADVVFNFFNFFETANIETAFRNASLMLKPKGKLVIMTIDSYYLMMALAKTMDEVKEVLKIYNEKKAKGEVPFFFQKVDLGNTESDNYEYASVLYSFEDYFKEAQKNGLKLNDYGEVVKTAKYIPKVYKYIVFENG
ncbi:MAG: class I SAM-dependent methyltransferase [Lacibacter sp.]